MIDGQRFETEDGVPQGGESLSAARQRVSSSTGLFRYNVASRPPAVTFCAFELYKMRPVEVRRLCKYQL